MKYAVFYIGKPHDVQLGFGFALASVSIYFVKLSLLFTLPCVFTISHAFTDPDLHISLYTLVDAFTCAFTFF